MQIRTTPEISGKTGRGGNAVTCFTPGTMITTTTGRCAVNDLKPDDRVLTRDSGFQPVVWIGQRTCSAATQRSDPAQAPILIRADALGPGLPAQDMIVSPRHRFLTTDPALLSALNETEALIEARALLGRPGISRTAPARQTYVHVLFDRHEVILSDNTWSESFRLDRTNTQALIHDRETQVLVHFAAQGHQPVELQPPARTCLPCLDTVA
ncbi:Hint domain-containing protein [Roseovarius sp. PS-C2]|uniref:Hint domain-containing protein n=1 Tax=Roseovarius sp. PS-C2 TaxID=2820814 RepID=UPI00263B385F|nr:Hint domain-containing protein [Roseovarius sp. PS-C2]MBU3259403.1 Hint domain-containing protein [Roseovarius sp. PS-C2]